MADKISGHSQPQVDRGPSRARPADRPADAARNRTDESARPARDAVSVSETATRLKAAEARLAEQPEVDSARVAEVRERVESGSYRVDSDAVAEKLLRLDQSLA